MTAPPPAVPYLDGLRIIDFTGALSGPFCTSILSDLGAEVVRIEAPAGDALRRRGVDDDGVSVPFQMVHRDKGSVALDITTDEGRAAARALIARADAVVENFRPGVLARHGLDWDAVKDDHPRLVYCSISGFGQTGPRSREGMVDLVAQGYAGLLSVTGSEDGELAKAGFPVSDLGAGMWAAIAVLAGLRRRDEHGIGGHLDVAMVDGVVSWSVWELADLQMTGEVPGPLGTAHRLASPYQAFRCRDGEWLTLAAVERQWPLFCALVDLGEHADDERFATEWTRYRNRRALAEVLQERFLLDDRDAWLARLAEAGIPCGPVNDLRQLLDDDQLRSRGVFASLELPTRTVTAVNTPIVGDGAVRARRPAPELGRDSRTALRDAGYDDAAIDALVAAGVVVAPAPAPVGGER